MALARTLIVKTAALKPIEALVRRSFLFRPLVRRFIAGDTLAEAVQASKVLCEAGLAVTLDYLGENTKTETEANAAAAAYMEILQAIAEKTFEGDLNISIKLTQCGLDLGDDFAEANYRRVLEIAEKDDTFVRVDMESSEYTDRTIDMIEKVFADHKNTGTVLQSCLHRSIDDTKRMIALGARVRVVKGAYLEPAAIAYSDKAEVDAKYMVMAKLLLKDGKYPAIATHDPKIIDEVIAFVKANDIGPERFEFQMLYGIRRDLQTSLRKDGWNVRVYVPYGDAWYPYFTRRLAERPANALFILKSLFKR